MGWLIGGVIGGLIGLLLGWWFRGLKPLPDAEPQSTAKDKMAGDYRHGKGRTTGRGGQ